MKFVVDMNLSPRWVNVLRSGGHEAVHWSDVGRFDAADVEFFRWAGDNQTVVFTNDLDFGAIIASTSATYPSVIQLRDLDVTPTANADTLLRAVSDHDEQLRSGALISIDARGSRVHILPIRRSTSE